MTEEELLSRLLYRDALMLVLNKPAGIPVHKGMGGGDNLESHFEQLRFGLPRTPALAHRLDRDTSGCLALGRNAHALTTLGKLFAQGKIKKTYWAIVQGAPSEPAGTIALKLKKRSMDARNWHMKVAEDGQEARTDWKIMASDQGLCWLELTPHTGRTHQLRVHCAEMGFPILGDKIYNPSFVPGERMQLHARSLVIPLYPKKEPVAIEAPPPDPMRQLLETLGHRP